VTVNIQNKKARFEYELLDFFTAGMQLLGTEIKSIRQGKASIQEGFCFMKDGELFIKNMHIAEYDFGNINNHDPLRERKLLLKRIELKKIEKKLKDQGVTVVPLKVYITEKGLAKMDIALARGKKLYDKRNTIKDRDVKRDLDRRKL
jgi:SsrA-binding protein